VIPEVLRTHINEGVCSKRLQSHCIFTFKCFDEAIISYVCQLYIELDY